MRYFDRLLNFFTSSYLNNTRFHHSTLGYLKIFFERNNKLKSTFSSLGNVFRNSKWSDLKVQNIKTSFIKSWSTYFLTIMLVILFIFPFFGTYYGGTMTYYVPLLGEVYELISFAWTHCEDLLKAFLISVFSTWSYLKSLLANNIAQKQKHVYSSITLSDNKLGPKLHNHTNISLSGNAAKNHAPIEMMYCLAHATKQLGNLKQAPSTLTDFSKIHFDSWNIDDCLDSDFCPITNYSKFLEVSALEYSYTATPKQTFTIHQLDIESSNLNKISSYNVALSLTGLNTQEALKASKEDRWLLRNSLLSENLIINSNAFTQSKKLLGVNFLSSDIASKNVWTSTKLNGAGNESTSNFLSNLQELFINQPVASDKLTHAPHLSNNMTNFDLFENSRMWLTKKYFFTNQLKNNTVSLSSVQGNAHVSPGSNEHLFNILVNTQSQNLNAQLYNLVLTLSSVDGNVQISNASAVFDIHVGSGDMDLLKLNNLSFVNKLTYSTSNNNLNYFTVLPYTSITGLNTLGFSKK